MIGTADVSIISWFPLRNFSRNSWFQSRQMFSIKGNLVGMDLTGTFAMTNQEGISIVGEAAFEIEGNVAQNRGPPTVVDNGVESLFAAQDLAAA